ncbi:MAG: PAS domain S-box protein, partial [Blastocatellia bacterium]|nr:PAS domain S-box protein [Blastocatellia bacterium]
MIDTSNRQAELEAAEIRYRRMFESAPEGILILDAETLKIIDANPFMVDLLGYSRDEFAGKELWEIGLLGDKQASKAAVRALQEHGYIRYEDMPLQTKGGTRREIEFTSWAYDEGEHKFIQCKVIDITERKRVTERKQAEATRFKGEQEFEALVENATDIVSRYDRKFRHLYVNRAVEQATGLPASAFIGKTHEEMGMPRHLQGEWHAVLEDVFASGKERETEYEFRTPGGPRFYHSRLVPEHAP